MLTPAPVLRRVQVVANPAAGSGRTARLLPRVEAALRATGHDVLVSPTRSLAHAAELAAGAVADDRVVAAMGGDGLVGRAAGAVADAGGLLAVLPGGRGDDVARALGLPRDPVAACGVLRDGVERRLDLGCAAGTAYVGVASVGFDSDVQERVLGSRLRLGRLVYAYGALAAVRAWRPARFALRVDGAPVEVTGWSVAVANTGRYGGGMRVAPGARPDDGLLDLVTVATLGRARFVAALPRVFRGSHVRLDVVRTSTAHEVVLDADRPFRVFADGEPVGALPCTVTVRPGALRVLLPR